MTTRNHPDLTFRNVKHPSDVPSCAPWPQRANGLDNLKRDYVIRSSFLITIFVVVLSCPQPKMIRPDTKPNVTVMQNPKSMWNRPEVHDPACYVRRDVSCCFRASTNSTAPVSISFGRGTHPNPACVCFVNLCPESFWERARELFSFNKPFGDFAHNQSSVDCVAPGVQSYGRRELQNQYYA